jgi:beta-propeller repeat-containing protein
MMDSNQRSRKLCAIQLGTTVLLATCLIGPMVRHPAQYSSLNTPRMTARLFPGFLANPGLFDSRVAYWNRNSLGTSYVLQDGRILHALPAGDISSGAVKKHRVWVVVESAAGLSPTLAPGRELPTSSFYQGHKAALARPLHSYEGVDLNGAWPGIDLKLRQASDGIERIYTVQPGAHPEQIRITLDGASDAKTTASGELRLATGVGQINYQRPLAFQIDSEGRRTPVAIAYLVQPDRISFGFQVGTYDSSRPLIIDPALQGTYLGDGGDEQVLAMTFDPVTGDTLVAGDWAGASPPAAYGGFQSAPQVEAVFIARCDRKLEQVLQSTLLGGSENEDVYTIAVDPKSRDVFIGGATNSQDFPGGGGGAEPTLPIGTESSAYVSRFSADLRSLQQTTFFNSTLSGFYAWGIAINPTTSDVYVVGQDDGGAVVTRYNEQLTQILSRFVLQGNVFDGARSIAINPTSGDVYVTGSTSSWAFPNITGGAFSNPSHPVVNGFERVFVARLDAALSTNFQSTFMWDGHTGSYANSIPVVIDPTTGDVIVACGALQDLGTIAGAAQPTFAGGNVDGFIVRFTADLKKMVAATYFGGSGDENISGLGVSLDGQSIYIGGWSNSQILPGETNPVPQQFNPFIARLDAHLTTIASTIFYTAYSQAEAEALAVHPTTGEVYIAGSTYASGLAGTGGGLDPAYTPSVVPAPNYNGFIARFDPALLQTDSTTPTPFSFPTQSGVALGSVVTSAPIRIYGYTTGVSIYVTGGSYSLDGQPFSTTSSTISPGQKVQLQHTASSSIGGIVETVLTVGGVDGTFDSIAQTGTGVTPSVFSFASINPVAPGKLITSNPITVQGTNAPAPISVAGGQYSIDNGPFTSAAGTVNSGQSVVLSQTASSSLATETDTTVTIGTASATFASVTDQPNTVPHAFAFTPAVSVPANTTISASGTFVYGINTPAPISIVGGQYVDETSVQYTSNPGSITNFEELAVQLQSGGPGSTASTTVTVGGVSATFTASVDGPIPAAAVPAPFTIPPVNGADANQWVQSVPITLTGFTVPSPVQPNLISAQYPAQWYAAQYNEFLAVPGNISPGQPLRVRLFAMNFNTTTPMQVSVGGVAATFKVTTIAQGGSTTPTSLQFNNHTDVTPGSAITSETITLMGLGAASTVTTSGCDVSVTGGAYSTRATVLNGDTLTLQIAAPNGAGESATCTVTVGTLSDTINITTSGTAAGSGKSGGGAISLGELLALLGILAARRGRRSMAHASVA